MAAVISCGVNAWRREGPVGASPSGAVGASAVVVWSPSMRALVPWEAGTCGWVPGGWYDPETVAAAGGGKKVEGGGWTW
jgi:hypothetical protein